MHPSSQSWLISQGIHILANKKMEPKTETSVLIKKAFVTYSAPWLTVTVSLNVIKLEPVRIKSKRVNMFRKK